MGLRRTQFYKGRTRSADVSNCQNEAEELAALEKVYQKEHAEFLAAPENQGCLGAALKLFCAGCGLLYIAVLIGIVVFIAFGIYQIVP